MTEEGAIKGILFDVHDTLIIKDYRASRQSRLNSVAALQEAGYQVTSEAYEVAWRKAAQVARQDAEELREVSFEGWYDTIFTSLGLSGYDPGLIQKVNQAWNQSYIHAIKALPQTKGVLRRLRRSYGLGIVSNSLAPNTIFDLTVAGILDFFDAVLISSDVGRRKPHPLIFLKALERMGLEPSEAVFVGNDPYEDVLGAKQVGMKTVLITHPLVEKARGQRENIFSSVTADSVEPDARIQGLRELVALLEEGALGGNGKALASPIVRRGVGFPKDTSLSQSGM